MVRILGQLSRKLLPRGGRMARVDSYTHVTIYRKGKMISNFNARLASVTRAMQMRLNVQGDATAHFQVAIAPRLTDALQGDDAWVGDEHFVVVLIEERLHETQIVLQRRQ